MSKKKPTDAALDLSEEILRMSLTPETVKIYALKIDALCESCVVAADQKNALPAATLGRKGGSAKSDSKATASKVNGISGGRPARPEYPFLLEYVGKIEAGVYEWRAWIPDPLRPMGDYSMRRVFANLRGKIDKNYKPGEKVVPGNELPGKRRTT